jgi:transcriptional regulator with XRE-family HTH domain
MEKFSEWVTAGRVRLGLSKSGLARELGVDRSAVTLWEKGKRDALGKNLVAMAILFQSYPGEKIMAKGKPAGKGPIQNLTSGKGGKKSPVAAPPMKGKKGGKGC